MFLFGPDRVESVLYIFEIPMRVTEDIAVGFSGWGFATEDQSYADRCAVFVVFASAEADRSNNVNMGQHRIPKPPSRNTIRRSSLAEDDSKPPPVRETAKRGFDRSKTELILIPFDAAAA